MMAAPEGLSNKFNRLALKVGLAGIGGSLLVPFMMAGSVSSGVVGLASGSMLAAGSMLAGGALHKDVVEGMLRPFNYGCALAGGIGWGIFISQFVR